MSRARILADYVSSGDELAATTTVASAALPKAGGAMTGAITTNSTFDGIDVATRDAVLTSTTTTAGAALPKAGGAMTGAITTNSTFDGIDIATRDAVLTSTTTTAGAALPKAGGTMTGTLTLSGDIVPSTPLSHRNMIINGAMNVAQRNTSNLNTGGEGYTICDRFRWTSGDYTDNFDFTQASITGVAGITKAWKVVNDVDEGSVPDAHIVGVQYKVEAQDFIRVLEADGTGTVPFTLSFYAKVSTGTGTYSVYLDLPDTSSSANSRYTSSFTVSDANWNRYEINIPANSVGIVTNDNGTGLDINWILVAGADFTGGTTGAWAVSSSNNNKKVSGQTQLWSGATGRSFELTGVQLELGSNATPFEHRSYGDELLRCQRYFRFNDDHITFPFKAHSGSGATGPTGRAAGLIWYPVVMRAAPTLTFTDSAGTANRASYHAHDVGQSGTDGVTIYYTSKFITHSVIVLNSYTGYDFGIRDITHDAEI